MITYTVTQYEQEDFDNVERNMTTEEAISILDNLPRGYFPYTKPSWGKADEVDFDNYKICCAIDMAIEVLSKKAKQEKDIKKVVKRAKEWGEVE